VPGAAIIQEFVGKNTTFKNITQINKLAVAFENFQHKTTGFCYIYATKSKFVVFFVKIELLSRQK
jgi:hypothetical protein